MKEVKIEEVFSKYSLFEICFIFFGYVGNEGGREI